VEQHILIDVTHMSQRALSETFARLDALDRSASTRRGLARGVRIRPPALQLARRELRAIAARRGVVGLIACKHYMSDGLPEPATFDESIATICRTSTRFAK